jgi:DnaJ domain
MDEWAALRLALDLLHVPWRVRLVRDQPLPEGVPLLLRVASGDADSEQAAAAATGRPGEVIKQAATFFIEQILLAPGTDSYRVLGASPAAGNGELRQNMALLMRWLHPDVADKGEQSIFAARISAAWNDLKTPDRRAAYDSRRSPPAPPGAYRPGGGRSGSGRSRRQAAGGGLRTTRLPSWVRAFLLGKSRP